MDSNQLCGLNYYGYGTYIAEGITKLCEGLTGSAVTSLRCAAAPSSLLCQRPLTLLPSHRSNLTHALQYWVQQDRRQGRLRARSHPQGDDDLQPQVRRHPIVVFLFCQRPLTRLLSHTVPILPLARSLGGNVIGAKGATALAAILNKTKITDLKCAAAPAVFAFMSAPIDTPPSLGSLAENKLCGLDWQGQGTYTADGITKLCEGLKGSAVTSLECAAAQECSLSCQRPLTPLSSHLRSRARSLRQNDLGPEGGAALAEGLKGNSTLRSLE